MLLDTSGIVSNNKLMDKSEGNKSWMKLEIQQDET